MGLPKQEYWSGLPCPPPGDLPDQGIEPGSPALQVDSLSQSHQGSHYFWGRGFWRGHVWDHQAQRTWVSGKRWLHYPVALALALPGCQQPPQTLLCLQVKGAEAGSWAGAAATQMTTALSRGTLSLEKGRDTCPLWQGKDVWLPFSHGGVRLEIQITCIRGTQTRPGVPDSDRWTPVSVSHYPLGEKGPREVCWSLKGVGEGGSNKEDGLGEELNLPFCPLQAPRKEERVNKGEL